MSASKQAERLVIEIRNLTEAQAIAIEDLLATWVELGRWGASRWTAFYADGDGNFRPNITINGHTPEKTRLLPNDATWPDGFHGEYRIDFDTVAWRLGQEREEQRHG